MNKERLLSRLYKRQSSLTIKYRKYNNSDSEDAIYQAAELKEQLDSLEYEIDDLESQIKRENSVR